MIEALALMLQPAVSPMPPQRTSDHVATVRYDCSIVDEHGSVFKLGLAKSGRMTIIGEYGARQKTSTNVPFVEVAYSISEGSSSRFDTMVEFVAKPRQIDWQVFTRTLDENGSFSSLFQMIRHKLSSGINPQTGEFSGLSLIMYMPSLDNPERTETLGGVCVATRLKDQSK